jgi:hypothetical protein
VQCKFSEFTYGYACTRELELDLAAEFPLAAAPVQPSLLTENVVGYDAALYAVDFTVMVQFKRADYIKAKHTNGACVSNGSHEGRCTWFHIERQHHRFEVDTSSNQWNAMHGHEVAFASTGQGLSMYLAPLFHTEQELNDHYAAGDVLTHSMWVEPSEFPADGSTHRYASTKDGGAKVRLSEFGSPRNNWTWGSVIAAARQAAFTPGADRQTLTLAGFGAIMSNVLPVELVGVEGTDTVQRVRLQLERAAALIGAALFVVGHPLTSDD